MKDKTIYSIIFTITLLALTTIWCLSLVDIVNTKHLSIACLISLCILNISKYLIFKNSSNKDAIQMNRCKSGAIIYSLATLILLIIDFIF